MSESVFKLLPPDADDCHELTYDEGGCHLVYLYGEERIPLIRALLTDEEQEAMGAGAAALGVVAAMKFDPAFTGAAAIIRNLLGET